ncbi:zinc finger protein 2-like [Stegodyphus dumicola]|uniref:zinc finger protein 2-like n=1 Tax=Stegodyphus dumicola TaxID=202533 RepID=UPI0015B30367|nr:zinc finger protein 2-like [Stegodyphus dumicola]XP_035215118.1 zinc finger protein 2-like [Stegodyphus dumicola]XP_035215119.1 zinc finger protein 2-like [Stegodyphus dumicola]XP_035215120.1 zinc finger protein 2-like [Stegodyphus dumicola]XP_035215121.1 zinc finger protein 2-like [Stegodyphus dumicola]
MSVLQVINRILPTSVLPEDFSNLVTPDDFGHPSKVQTLSFVDPRNGQHFVIQSTFCPRKLKFSGKNIHEEIAATCERIPGLICITNLNSVQDTLNKECTGEEFALTIPNSISKHEIFEQNILSNGKTKIEGSGSNVNCDNKLDDDLEQLKKMTACKPADVNDHKPADDQNKRRKLLLPLVKYFLENECLICGFHGEHITKHNACKHMLSHIRLGSYFCNDQFFTSAANLYSYAINQPETETYFCNLCGAKYKRKIFLSMHKKNKHVKSDSYSSDLLDSKHYPVKQKISICFACVVCNEKFTSLKSVIDHRNVHLGKGRYRCLTCSKIFTSICLVRYHSHVRIVIKSYKCGICDKRFLSNRSLKVHRNSHMKKMLFSCKWCEKKFYIRNNLMEHLELSHTNY